MPRVPPNIRALLARFARLPDDATLLNVGWAVPGRKVEVVDVPLTIGDLRQLAGAPADA